MQKLDKALKILEYKAFFFFEKTKKRINPKSKRTKKTIRLVSKKEDKDPGLELNKILIIFIVRNINYLYNNNIIYKQKNPARYFFAG